MPRSAIQSVRAFRRELALGAMTLMPVTVRLGINRAIKFGLFDFRTVSATAV